MTTTAESTTQVPAVAEPEPEGTPDVIPQPEQAMLSRNMQHVAQELLDTNTTAKTISWQEKGQQYSARVMRQPAADSTGLEQVIAEVTTSKDGKRMKTRLSLKRLAFSHFTQLVNNWDPNIMLHDDVIDGRFHSNSEISLSAMYGVKPKFFGKVTTAAQKVTFNSFNTRRNQDVFQGGFETKTDRVTLPRDMPDVVNGGTGETTRRSFVEDTRIIFNADGSYAWRLANGEGSMQRAEPSEQPQYLIGEKGAKLYVRGTVRGIFTVYSPSDIEIEDDLVYLKDPRQTVISRDFLALISGRDIKVARGLRHGPRRSDRACRAVRTPTLHHRRDRPRRCGHDVHLWQSDGRHDHGHRASLRHQARLRQTLRIPAARELSDDAALRGRLLGPGLETGRRSRKRPAGGQSRPIPVIRGAVAPISQIIRTVPFFSRTFRPPPSGAG